MKKTILNVNPNVNPRLKSILRNLAIGFILFSAILATLDSTEDPKICTSCTYVIDDADNSTLNLSDGDIICITESGEFTGTINRWSGSGNIQICNEGVFNPNQLNLNAGSNQIDNYGIIDAGTINIYNDVSSATIINYADAEMTTATLVMQGENTSLHTYGDFDPGKITIDNGATLKIYEGVTTDLSDITINAGNLINEGNIDMKDKSFDINAGVSVSNYGLLANILHLQVNTDGILKNWGEIQARLHFTVNDSVQHKGGKIQVGGHLTVNSGGVLNAESEIAVDRNMTINGTIEGPASGSYGWIEVDGKTTVNSSGTLTGQIDVCDSGSPSGGLDSNTGTIGPDVTYCENSGAVSMPVEFLDFYAQYEGNAVELNWLTATELNNDYFSIERSTDGVLFMTIGTVKGVGTTDLAQSYSFLDTEPLNKPTIYRLKQTDIDGSNEYSSMVEVTPPSLVITQIEGKVYPNPTDGKTTLALQLAEVLQGQLMVTGINGQIVAQQPIDLAAGNHQIPIDLSSVAAGVYFISMKNNGASKFSTLQIVKR